MVRHVLALVIVLLHRWVQLCQQEGRAIELGHGVGQPAVHRGLKFPGVELDPDRLTGHRHFGAAG